jgi:diadenosine tetraphosphate (Ap4A) HIT family hydrolase
MRLVVIRTKYDIFEGRPVEDHLMIVPKRHIEAMSDMTDHEALDMIRLIGDYEARGYNIYARGVGSVSRSVAHQHTHLIKLKEKQTKLLFYLKKPYHLIQF